MQQIDKTWQALRLSIYMIIRVRYFFNGLVRPSPVSIVYTDVPSPLPNLHSHNRPTHCSELRMASSPAGRGSSLRSDASSTIEPSGCGGLNERSWTSSCSLITDVPAAAAMNPRNGGDGFSGRVQNSGCAWKPTKYGCSAHTSSRQRYSRNR